MTVLLVLREDTQAITKEDSCKGWSHEIFHSTCEAKDLDRLEANFPKKGKEKLKIRCSLILPSKNVGNVNVPLVSLCSTCQREKV